MTDPALTVPATMPGVLRRGTPVLWTDPETGHCLRLTVVYLSGPDDPRPTVCPAGMRPQIVDRSALHVDLRDVTGRLHVMLALAAWWETTRGAGQPSEVPLHGCAWYRIGGLSWLLTWRGCGVVYTTDGCDVPTYVSVDAVRALDPADVRRLDDGTRWIDAAALAIVARTTLEAPC